MAETSNKSLPTAKFTFSKNFFLLSTAFRFRSQITMTRLSVSLKKFNSQKKRYKLLFFSALSLLTACTGNTEERLTIAVAANMQFAIKPLAEAFENQSGIDCEIILGSSGKLTAQIKAGAPYDVFLSADMRYPQSLLNDSLTRKIPQVYAYGRLIAWTLQETAPTNSMLTDWIERLAKRDKVAIANPKTAPYGRATEEALRAMDLYPTVAPHLVYGESIAQVNQFITSGSAVFGFTARSVVMAPDIAFKGRWLEVDPGLYSPMAQGAVILNNRQAMQKKADRFMDFLFSDEAREILHKFGYFTTLE